MPDNGKKERPRGKSIFRIRFFSRRQFLKHAFVAAAGMAITALPAACKSSGNTKTTTGASDTGDTSPGTSTNPTSSSTTPTSSVPASSSTTSITSTTSTAKPPASGYFYIPSTAAPPLKAVPGSDCVVATDRSYANDHIWVLSQPANVVVMGISSTMVEILSEPHRVSLSPVGTALTVGAAFGTIEGFKMSADLLAPVSGTIIETNDWVVANSNDFGVIAQINDDPYRAGWMIVVRLSKPTELSTLLTPQQYINLLAK